MTLGKSQPLCFSFLTYHGDKGKVLINLELRDKLQ